MKDIERSQLGLFLEELRGGKPLREIAIKSGLSHTYIRDLELGINRKTKAPINPTPETLKRLAEAYNYSYEDLMEKAGYIEENETSKILDKFLHHIVDNYNIDEDILRDYGQQLDGQFIGMKKLLEVMGLEVKLDFFMAITDNLQNVVLEINERGEKEFVLGHKMKNYDLEEDTLADELNLTYKGMKLNRNEKIEFLSIARAIFDARRGMKEKD